MIVHGDIDMLNSVASQTDEYEVSNEQALPGPITRASQEFEFRCYNGGAWLQLRPRAVTARAAEIIEAAGVPIAAPSANPPANRANDIRRCCWDAIRIDVEAGEEEPSIGIGVNSPQI